MSLHRDLLAELELTMVPSLRIRRRRARTRRGRVRRRGASGSRRTFWCSLKEEEVEVVETKPSRVPAPAACSVAAPSAAACGRHCLDSKFRRQWPSPAAGPG